MNTVAAFYSDVALWAQQDAYWAEWVAPQFIYDHDTAGSTKERRRLISEQHHKIRQLAPVLPQLVTAAEAELAQARDHLAEASAAGNGARLILDGREWEVVQVSPNSPIRVRGHSQEKHLTDREDAAFWIWAAVEVLRHSGIRIEELLELTHLSLQPYTVPQTGEVVPLLHIAPSKSDEERLLVAGPELAHVLAQVIARVRGGDGAVPLVQRYDQYEKTWSDPLPFLFQGRQRGGRAKVVGAGAIRSLLNALLGRADIQVAGRTARLTPHDFRRIFATDALASGMPPHIIQQLMGHKSIVTTQGYAAVYPQHVIREHRSFIARRRQTRPSDEYREPTPEEWDEFERHFITRRVELGSCGRAYGSSCQHEHACIRCSLLRPDPAQKDRLTKIAANLRDRIKEAEANGWLGEAEGLQTSLAAAEAKLDQMRDIDRRRTTMTMLPMPTTRIGKR
jgi:integrase